MQLKVLKILSIVTLGIIIFSCDSSKDNNQNDFSDNSSNSLSIDIEKNPNTINVLEEKKDVYIAFDENLAGKNMFVNLPTKQIEINSSMTQQIKLPKDINYIAITNEQNELVALAGTFTEKVEITPENIALFIVLANTPLLKIDKLSSESLNNIKSDLSKLDSFNNLVTKIKNQLDSNSYIDILALKNYISSAVRDFFNMLVDNQNISYSSILISPSNEYHFDLMLEIQKDSFVATNMYDKYGNRVYKGKIDVYNSGLLWQELCIINPSVAVSNVCGFVSPMMVSDFVGTFTSINGLKQYFSDLINLNITNSKWDAKKTTLELLVSCEYNTLCSYIGVKTFVVQYIDSVLKLVSFVGKDNFNKFIEYIVSKPDVINQIYNYIKNEDYISAIFLIKDEFQNWAKDKIKGFVISTITNQWNILQENLNKLDILQSQITKFLSLIEISKNAKYCWKFENIKCDKRNTTNNNYVVSDHSDITEGRIISDLNNTNLKIRIVPEINWIEGNYKGIVCDINTNGEWGTECILYTGKEDFKNSEQCQVIIFEDTNDSWRFEKEENSIYGTNIPCSQLLGKYISLDINNPKVPEQNNCQSNSLGKYTYIGNIELDSWQYIDGAIIEPNENTCWYNGKNVTIKWDNSKLSEGNKVDILILYDDPSGIDDYSPDVCVVASKNWALKFENVDNTGYLNINVGELSGYGNAYKLLIITEKGQWSMSKGTFSLNTCN